MCIFEYIYMKMISKGATNCVYIRMFCYCTKKHLLMCAFVSGKC